MTIVTVSISCPCEETPTPLISKTNQRLETWQAMIRAGKASRGTCPVCRCLYDPTDEGTSIGQADVSQPGLDSINVSSGTIAGGTAITLTGHKLDLGTLTVKFNGISGVNVRSRTSTTAIVDTPAGHVFLSYQGEITGALGRGDRLTGGTSGHTATIESVDEDEKRIEVSVPTGSFTAGEWVAKDTDNKVQLSASNHIDLDVSITVENENGERSEGGGLVGVFSYTIGS